MICITIQRTLSVAKVRYLIGDKECFKIFYPRFFAWDKSVFIKPYSSLFFAISISIHSNICGNGSCFLNGLFRLHILILSCVLYKSQPSSKKDSPRTSDFLRLWHGKKNPWRYALKYFKTIQPRTFLCLPCWQRLTFIATTRSSIFIAQSKRHETVARHPFMS